jgi:hypothetical protein
MSSLLANGGMFVASNTLLVFLPFIVAGAGLADPFAGYRPPGTEQRTGRGLWLARQVVDLMQMETGKAAMTIAAKYPTVSSRKR